MVRRWVRVEEGMGSVIQESVAMGEGHRWGISFVDEDELWFSVVEGFVGVSDVDLSTDSKIQLVSH